MKTNPNDVLTSKFLKFESYFIKEEDWELWESIRYYLYYHLRALILNLNDVNSIRTSRSINYLYSLNEIIKFIWRCLKSRHKVLFFAASRFKDAQGYNYDPNILDVYDILKDNCMVIDSVSNAKSKKYDTIPNLLVPALCKMLPNKGKYKIPPYIVKAINEEFNVEIDESLFRPIIKRYYIEKASYNTLFKLLTPKGIFITQQNIQKGLFWAAKNNRIPLIEFQHGTIFFSHLAYSYPKKLFHKNLLIPDYLFLFSEFWQNKIIEGFPIDHCFISGNSASSEIKHHTIKFDLTFISSSLHIDTLILFLEEMRRKGYAGHICLKLHPNEHNHIESVKEIFKNDDKVDVIYTEISMKDIIGMSNALITIQSTSVYEALDAGKKVFIIKSDNYEDHSDVFDNPKIKLIDKAEEVINDLNANSNTNFSINTHITYFEKFKKEKVTNLLKKLGIYDFKNNNG